MKLIHTLLLCFFLCFGSPMLAQVYKFRATSYSLIERNANGNWGNWSEFKEATVIITLDGKKNRIVVGSKEIQLFNIIAYGEKIATEFDETLTFECKDNGGGSCSIQIITRKNQGNRMQFYINYADVKFVYNIYVSE